MSIATTQKEFVQESFAQVIPIADQAAILFYDHLFELDPSLRVLFKSDMKEQRRKLMQTLQVAVAALDNLDALVPVLRKLAITHVGYGVRDEHYATVGSALLWTLEQGLGEAFTDEIRSAWAAIYTIMSSVMKEAANEMIPIELPHLQTA
ncbi:MAG: globin family protein [Chloroflexota bacterium]